MNEAPIHDFDEVLREERRAVGLGELDPATPAGVGLAISGGGIRSAAFALGVVQELLNRDWFRRFHFLSTVSGGGYLGAALTWLKRLYAGRDFAAQLGRRDVGARSCESARGKERLNLATEHSWLDFIRQHGSYLKPGRISALALGGVALRGVLFNLAVYGGALVALMRLLIASDFLPGTPPGASAGRWYSVESLVLVLAVLVAANVLLYGPATWLSSVGHRLAPPAEAESGNPGWLYPTRTWHQRLLGSILGLLAGALVLWSVPYVTHGIRTVTWPPLAGAISSGLGALGALYQFVAGRDQAHAAGRLGSVRILLSAMLLIYGLLVLAYWAASSFADVLTPTYAAALLFVCFVLGWFANLNYVSLGRMYRDRLMEAFMPDCSAIETNTWQYARGADRSPLIDFWPHQGKGTPPGWHHLPLHLVNCNVVLVDARHDKFRGRGGDNFFLSPLFSGSSATGWVYTSQLGDGRMSLASAVAASGAAANPYTGVAGRGITRNRFVSMLLALMNVRLGYWVPNPLHSLKRHALAQSVPNLWRPGLWQGLLGRGFREDAIFLELTDGGHFDNTGVYELIRRRVKVIVLVQGSQDASFATEDLANVIERVRADFGVHIRFDIKEFPLEAIRPKQPGELSTRGFAVGRIKYPVQPQSGGAATEGVLLYLQASPVPEMRADTRSYWLRHPQFPNQPTADQFFDEEQFEAYRELGYCIAEQAFNAVERAGSSGEGPPAMVELYRAFAPKVESAAAA